MNPRILTTVDKSLMGPRLLSQLDVICELDLEKEHDRSNGVTLLCNEKNAVWVR